MASEKRKPESKHSLNQEDLMPNHLVAEQTPCLRFLGMVAQHSVKPLRFGWSEVLINKTNRTHIFVKQLR